VLLERYGVTVEQDQGCGRQRQRAPNVEPRQEDVGEHAGNEPRKVLHGRDQLERASRKEQQTQEQRIPTRALRCETDRVGAQREVEVDPRVVVEQRRPIGEVSSEAKKRPDAYDYCQATMGLDQVDQSANPTTYTRPRRVGARPAQRRRSLGAIGTFTSYLSPATRTATQIAAPSAGKTGLPLPSFCAKTRMPAPSSAGIA